MLRFIELTNKFVIFLIVGYYFVVSIVYQSSFQWDNNELCRNPLAQFEIEKKEHQERLKNMKAGMEKVMEEKVKEKMTKMEEQKNEVIYNYTSFRSCYIHFIDESGRLNIDNYTVLRNT